MPTLKQIKEMPVSNYKVTDLKFLKGKPLEWEDRIMIFIQGDPRVKTATRRSAYSAGLCDPATKI